MVREILTYPKDKEILSLKSMKVQDINNEETKTVIQDLKDTLKETKNGKGMSAIQIGYPLQICICSYNFRINHNYFISRPRTNTNL